MQPFIVIQVHDKLHETCLILLAHFTETMQVVKNLFSKKLMVKNVFIIIEDENAVATHLIWLYEAIPLCTINICY